MAWNQTSSAPKKAPTRQGLSPVVKGLLALVVICALGGLVWWFVSGNSEAKERKVKSVGAIAEALPQIAPASGGCSNGREEHDASLESEIQKTPEEIEAEERAKDPLYDRHHIVAKKPLLAEPIEQLMLSVFETEVGEMPPMLPAVPSINEQQFRKIIDKMTAISPDDSEATRNAKDLVNQVKVELRKYLDEGGTIDGFLSYYVNILDSAYRERMTTREMVMKSMKVDSPEVARDFFLKANERLSEKGIKLVTLTNRQKAYLGLTDN